MASLTSTHLRPMTVKEITKRAEAFEYNQFVPLRYWLRTAETLRKEAQIYEDEGNDQQAYLLLFRHAKLVLEHLSTHPDGRRPENRLLLVAVEKALPTTLEKLEQLKPRIAKRHDQWQAVVKERELRRSVILNAQDPTTEIIKAHRHGEQPITDAPVGDLTTPDEAQSQVDRLVATDNPEAVVRMAHKEIKRRDAVRRAAMRRLEGLAPDKSDMEVLEEEEVQRMMKDTRSKIDHSPPTSIMPTSAKMGRAKAPPYKYPTIPKRDAADLLPAPLPSPSIWPPRPISKLPPLIPSKAPLTAADRPAKDPTVSAPIPPPYQPLTTTIMPPPARPSTPVPSTFSFPTTHTTESGSPLRTLFLPPTLLPSFLSLSNPNTANNLETCGILCGTLISNALFTTHLLIPAQTSTSDTCDTTNEAGVFAFCDARDLLVLGWIHTHPRQDCFLSSRDLHTHAGYQVMMPEAIAIVCAPSRQPDIGLFRLTDPPGLHGVLACSNPGIFHPHDQIKGGIYTSATRPGHVVEAHGLTCELVDLRSGDVA